jgi:hypothetical protein
MKRPSRTTRKQSDRSDDFDSPWKTLLERYYPAFMAWFFPPIARDRLGPWLRVPGPGVAEDQPPR